MLGLIFSIVVALAICAALGLRRLGAIGGYIAWFATIFAITGIVFVAVQ